MNKPCREERSELLDKWGEQLITRGNWWQKNRYFHGIDVSYMKRLMPKEQKVVAVGYGQGHFVEALNIEDCQYIELCTLLVDYYPSAIPNLPIFYRHEEDPDLFSDLTLDSPIDILLLPDTLGFLEDIQLFLERIFIISSPQTRIVCSYHSQLWGPLLKLAEHFKIKRPSPPLNYLEMRDTENFISLANFETVKKDWRILIPLKLLGLETLINRFLAPLPFLRKLCLRHYLVARPNKCAFLVPPSVSIVIPCKNEEGNVATAVKRIPTLTTNQEIIFVEGGSTDGTVNEIQRVIEQYDSLDIKLVQQDGTGKGNAVKSAFDRSNSDILIILDADLTVPPEDLGKFYEAIKNGKGEFINGTRLIYDLEHGSMQLLNYFANHIFASIFTYLLNQRFTDTLCGTKALTRRDYELMKSNKHILAGIDPFGDFDLILGAAFLNLKMQEIPIRYDKRRFGTTQILRFKHGFQLLRMMILIFFRLKLY